MQLNRGVLGGQNKPKNLLAYQVCLQSPVNCTIPSKFGQGLSISDPMWSLSMSNCVLHGQCIVWGNQILVCLMFCMDQHQASICWPKSTILPFDQFALGLCNMSKVEKTRFQGSKLFYWITAILAAQLKMLLEYKVSPTRLMKGVQFVPWPRSSTFT